MRKSSILWITLLVICSFFMFSLSISANDLTDDVKKEQRFSMVANEEQLKTLNSLYGTDISYGELIEKVYPEALKDIPDEILADMYKTKQQWPSEDIANNDLSKSISPNKEQKLFICVTHDSDIDANSVQIDYSSESEVALPLGGYDLPYMSVLTGLEREGDGVLRSKLEYGYWVSDISASNSYYIPSSGNYRTFGTHTGQFPAGYNPSFYTFNTNTSWEEIE